MPIAAMLCGLVALCLARAALAAVSALDPAAAERDDSRIRTVPYSAERVYALRGFVGYQIDLQFEPGETFVGLGAGDMESLTFAAQDNHLFLKPRAAQVETNLTVLTSRRAYQFTYVASGHPELAAARDAIFAVRFLYAAPAPAAAVRLDAALAQASAIRPRNQSYGFCGRRELKPERAWDDGVQTHLQFGARQELPAVFVRNDDGSESLVNFTVQADEVVVHRVVHRLALRRGQLIGCVVNQGYTASGEQLGSGTVSPVVERGSRGAAP
ncbi:MAG: TrbG/VirB9 family P-type conjugative transfer protein [Proteobacteria bacterium]|nr:TrbG/VirB9 family P-type conjugative transfer protein [Pseudomonadota bacterium]